MRRLVLAVLVIGCSTFVLGNREASAFGWYRKDGDFAYHAGPGLYCWRGPRWNFAAAYYQSYRYRRVYGRKCRCW